MSIEDLREILNKLRTQLEDATPKSDQERELLERAVAEIRTALDAAGAPTAESHGPVLERLKEITERFEDNHPDLTFAIGRLSDMLGKLGI